MPLDVWLTFVAASTALLLIPGPTVLLVLSYALSKGRSVALASAAGVALGDLVAMTASLVGLGALVLASATAFSLLKWTGAAWRARPGKGREPAQRFRAHCNCHSTEPQIHRFFHRLCAAVYPD